MFAFFNLSADEQKRVYKELAHRAGDLQPVIIEALHSSYATIVKNQGREIDRLNELNREKDRTIERIRSSMVFRIKRKLYSLFGKNIS